MPAKTALQVMISKETSTEMDVGVIEKNNWQFFMVGTIIDHSNDIKSSKLCKTPAARGSTWVLNNLT